MSVDPAKAREILNLPEVQRRTVVKTRFAVPHEGLMWEVDRFGGKLAGLWLAEVELTDPDQPIYLPSWVGREVSEDPTYTNQYLSRPEVSYLLSDGVVLCPEDRAFGSHLLETWAVLKGWFSGAP